MSDSSVSRTQKQVERFMLLSSEHYIEVSNELANKCMKFSDKCMSNRVPKAIISGIVPQHIAQYFGMKEVSNGFVKSYSKLFLLNIEENTLIYTSLRNTEIRISCENEKPKVSNLIGRGVLKITRGCKVSSQFFTLNHMQQLGTLKYQSSSNFRDTSFSSSHIWNTSVLDTSVTMNPTPALTGYPNIEPSSLYDLPKEYVVILAIIISSFCFSFCCCLMLVVFCRYSFNGAIETHV